MNSTPIAANEFAGYPVICELPVYRVDFATWEREGRALGLHPTAIPAYAHNDVVGYLSLSTSLGGIKGHLQWRYGARRSTARPSGKFFGSEFKVFELWFDSGHSSDEIFDAVMEGLRGLVRRQPVRGHDIDFAVLQAIGPHLDWRALVGLRADGQPRLLPPR
jgi:hypothetical protein